MRPIAHLVSGRRQASHVHERAFVCGDFSWWVYHELQHAVVVVCDRTSSLLRAMLVLVTLVHRPLPNAHSFCTLQYPCSHQDSAGAWHPRAVHLQLLHGYVLQLLFDGSEHAGAPGTGTAHRRHIMLAIRAKYDAAADVRAADVRAATNAVCTPTSWTAAPSLWATTLAAAASSWCPTGSGSATGVWAAAWSWTGGTTNGVRATARICAGAPTTATTAQPQPQPHAAAAQPQPHAAAAGRRRRPAGTTTSRRRWQGGGWTASDTAGSPAARARIAEP